MLSWSRLVAGRVTDSAGLAGLLHRCCYLSLPLLFFLSKVWIAGGIWFWPLLLSHSSRSNRSITIHPTPCHPQRSTAYTLSLAVENTSACNHFFIYTTKLHVTLFFWYIQNSHTILLVKLYLHGEWLIYLIFVARSVESFQVRPAQTTTNRPPSVCWSRAEALWSMKCLAARQRSRCRMSIPSSSTKTHTGSACWWTASTSSGKALRSKSWSSPQIQQVITCAANLWEAFRANAAGDCG